MKPRQPGIETAKALLEAPRVPTPADKFWKMRGSPIALSAGSQARDLKLSLDTYGANPEPSHRPDEGGFLFWLSWANRYFAFQKICLHTFV